MIKHYCVTMTRRYSACGLEYITPRTTVKMNVTCKNCRKTKKFKRINGTIF